MEQGILYGVGVGPGDPELLTLKAVRILREADVIAVPDTGNGEKAAQRIVADYIEDKELVFCHMPMSRDKILANKKYNEAADKICALLDAGLHVAFITLGDPSVYSTYMYLHKRIAGRGYQAEMIPGVPSFCAAAARLGDSLCEGGESLLIIPASYPNLDLCLDFPGNKVFMKAGRSLLELRDKLQERGRDQVNVVSNCGMENEKVYQSLTEIDENAGYFSIVITKE